LLETALVVFNVTADFLLTIASDGTEHGVLLANYAVYRSVNVVLGTSCVVLGLSGNMFFAARLLPGGSPRKIPNRLNDGTLDRVVLASGLVGLWVI